MNIYFIANKPLTEEELEIYNTLIPNDNDLIVRFNDGKNKELFDGRVDVFFTRCRQTKCQGFDIYQKHLWYDFFKLYIIKNKNSILTYEDEILNNNNIKISYIDKDLDIFYNPNAEPTTGFYGIEYLTSRYNKVLDKYYLIGFDFFKSDQKKWNDPTIIHDFKYEYDYYSTKKLLDDKMIWL